MNSTIRQYYKRRKLRLTSRGIHYDSTDMRFDANARLAYGIAKGLGIDTQGMEPQEVWEAIEKKDPSAAKKYQHTNLSKKSKAQVKGGETFSVKEKYRIPRVKGMNYTKVKQILTASSKISRKHYDEATKKAGEPGNDSLRTFTSHGIDHVHQVIERGNQAADIIENIPASKNGFKYGKIDRKKLLIACDFHDTGMDGGDGYNYSAVAKNKDGEYDGDKLPEKMGELGGQLRESHAINSAIHVLESADEVSKLGVSPSEIAFIAFAHTKSMSGIRDLSNPEDWQKGINNIKRVVEKYNTIHKDDGKHIEFNENEIFKGGKPTKKNIASLAAAVAATRLGDANRESTAPLKSQCGAAYNIDKHPKGNDYGDASSEAKAAVISITHDGKRSVLGDEKDDYLGKITGKSQAFSKKIVLGERNMHHVNVTMGNDGSLREEIELSRGDSVPYCTADAISERMGELNTINGVKRAVVIKMTGVKNMDALGKAADAYNSLWYHAKNKYPAVGKDGNPYIHDEDYPGVDDLIMEFDDGSQYSFAKGNGNMPVKNPNNKNSK